MYKGTIEFLGETFDKSHGSPFDRGSADSYYGRPQEPHWYPKGTGVGERVGPEDMTIDEMRAYYRGYRYNEEFGDKKSWD